MRLTHNYPGVSSKLQQKGSISLVSRTTITIKNLRNLLMGQISKIVLSWQAFIAQSNVRR
jgi:hypothetical protein